MSNDWVEACKDRLDPQLQANLRQEGTASAEPKFSVLIRMKDHVKVSQLTDICPVQSGDEAAALPTVGMFAGKLCTQTIRRLAEHSDVKLVCIDREVRALLNVAVPAIESTAVRNSHGLTGRNVGIAVLDTGVYPHPDLTNPANRIIAFRDFIQGRTEPYDDNGHGTHVAGCAASNGFLSGGYYSGSAPEANIIGVKVLDEQGSGSYSTILSGIDYCIQNRESLNIRIMNLSLGAIPFTDYSDDPLAAACRAAWRAGIVVCAAAGNTGPEGTINTPGFDPLIITVGALNDFNTEPRSDDRYAPYTSRGPTVNGFIKPDLAVPGTNITSLLAPNSTLARQYPGNIVAGQYLTLTGTSMAAPICAGACAQILQAYPVLTPDQIKVLLKETSQYFQANTPGYLIVSRALYLPIL